MAGSDAVLDAYLGISCESAEERVLKLLIELGAQFVGATEGSLLVLDEEQGDLVFAMTVGDRWLEKPIIGQRVPIGEGITGLAAQSREVQIGAPTFGIDQHEEPSAVLAAPLLIGDRLIGVLTAVSFEPQKRFDSGDAALYARIASVAAVVVEQRRRLSAIESIQRDGTLPEALNEDERLDRQIVGSVQRLVQAKRDAKARIARLLAAVEELAAE